MKKIMLFVCVLIISGCSITPYKDLGLDTTSNFNTPTPGRSGIYVYQLKMGIYGAIYDVNFEIKDGPTASLNTGEYATFEIDPGMYEYKFSGGFIDSFVPVEFEPNQNYFFHARISNFTDLIYLVRDQDAVNAAKKNILSGRYEINTLD